jgi:hypothetical protein
MSIDQATAAQTAEATVQNDLAGVIRKFTARLRRDFEANILQDSHGFKKQVVKLFRLHLPPGPGRPQEESITHAEEMRAEGAPWLEVYKKCIPGFLDLDDESRVLAMIRLRDSVRSRRCARRRRIFPRESQR